uniref:Uncharacterized protein n=2 Tax=Sipha flava TaxID=143950 RepID=A0A2S2QTS4_9HEMI
MKKTKSENRKNKLSEFKKLKTSNELFKSKKYIKQKKLNLSSIDNFDTEKISKEKKHLYDNNIKYYSSNECLTIANEIFQNHESIDTSLNVISMINEGSKSKKKDNNSFIDCSNESESIDVINNCLKECVTTEKKCQNHELFNTTLDDTLNINNENFKSKKHKKKKKHSNDIGLTDFTTNNAEKKIFDENDVSFDNSSPKECGTTKKIHQNHESLDRTLDDTLSINDESFKSKKHKKKKKHSNDIGFTDFTTINAEKKIFDKNEVSFDNSSPKECGTTEKIHQNHESLDRTLDDTLSINDESFKSKKHKKNKEHSNDIGLTDFTTINAEKMIFDENVEGFIDDTSNIESNELLNKKKEDQNHKSPNKLSDNITSTSNVNFDLNKTMKKRKHDKSLSSVDFTKKKRKLLNDIFFKLSGKKKKYNNNSTNKIIDEFTNIVKDIKLLQQNITISDGNSSDQNANKSNDNQSNDTVSIDTENNSQIISNADNTTVNHDTQENIEFEAFQSAINLHSIENSSSTTETQVPLDKSKLINDIINNETSLNSHPHFDLIVKYFTSEMKKILIKRCVCVLPSEIILLKIIGKKVLEKCVEKQKNLKIVENLHIVVPNKSKENKIHYVETTLSKFPKNKIIEKIKELNPSIKLGVFNEDEDNLIKKYWLKFQQEYKISDVRPFLPNGLDIALHSSERLSFIRYISVELPNRLLYSVYNRFVVLFDKRIIDKQSFREVEDRLIMQVNNCVAVRNKYTVLNLLLNRTKQQLIRRSNFIKLHPSCKERIIWNIEKRQELFSKILLETNTTNWTDLENLKIKKPTWIKVAKNFSVPISDEKVRVQWKFLSTMLFCKQPICYSTFKLNLLKLLLQKKC